jgi:carbonic anhydrase
MLTFTDEVLREKLRKDLGKNADGVAFLPFSDLRQSVLDDVQLLETNELLLDVPITGYIYDVKTGAISKVTKQ